MVFVKAEAVRLRADRPCAGLPFFATVGRLGIRGNSLPWPPRSEEKREKGQAASERYNTIRHSPAGSAQPHQKARTKRHEQRAPKQRCTNNVTNQAAARAATRTTRKKDEHDDDDDGDDEDNNKDYAGQAHTYTHARAHTHTHTARD